MTLVVQDKLAKEGLRLGKGVAVCLAKTYIELKLSSVKGLGTSLGLPVTYLPDPVKSEGCVSSTHDMCLWVMKLSSSVTVHLLDFRVRAFNNCWLLIILKNTSRHWVLRCSQATQAWGW